MNATGVPSSKTIVTAGLIGHVTIAGTGYLCVTGCSSWTLFICRGSAPYLPLRPLRATEEVQRASLHPGTDPSSEAPPKSLRHTSLAVRHEYLSASYLQ